MNKKIYYNDKKIGIALIAFNRPRHLQENLRSLKKNNIKKIYIFCDSPKEGDNKNKLKNEEVILIINSINWCEVILTRYKKNLGCKKIHMNVMEYMFKKYDKLIILEDDLICSPHLIEFLSRCLIKYENETDVKNITGYCPPIEIPNNYKDDVFFLKRHGSWGLGTWKRVYKEFLELDFNHKKILVSKKNRMKLKKGGTDTVPLMTADYFGWVDSIGIWWSWNSLVNNGINLYPTKSLIKNMGHDNSGTHSGISNKYIVDMDHQFIPQIYPNSPVVNNLIQNRYFEFIKVSKIGIFIYDLPLFMIRIIVPFYNNLLKLFRI